MIGRAFRLREHGTDVRTEVQAGFTTILADSRERAGAGFVSYPRVKLLRGGKILYPEIWLILLACIYEEPYLADSASDHNPTRGARARDPE